MKYFVVLSALTLLLVTACGKAISTSTTTNQDENGASYAQADTRNGALLYDNWLTIAQFSPGDNHPLYPADSKKSGKSTWRCKECHGWDYVGDQGRYSKGSHYTGISGVYDARIKNSQSLFRSLTDSSKPHDFSAHLEASQIWDLVKFLKEGQKDFAQVVDARGKPRGSAVSGKPLYETHCASCHDDDGNGIDFKTKKDGIQGVGWLANENPQESIHKIRWGHPGSDMPSMVTDGGLSEQQMIDILAYSQTLENKEL